MPQLTQAYGESEGFVETKVVDGDLSDEVWEYQVVYESTSNATSESVATNFEDYLLTQDEVKKKFEAFYLFDCSKNYRNIYEKQ